MASDACNSDMPAPPADLSSSAYDASMGASIRAQAYAFQKLCEHLQMRSDVQNIEVMNLAGFCRNCLSKWYQAGMAAQSQSIEYDVACEVVYGIPYADWKKKYQKKATPEQLAIFEATHSQHAKHPKLSKAEEVKSSAQQSAPSAAKDGPSNALVPTPKTSGQDDRKSKFPMIDMDEALSLVLDNCKSMESEQLPVTEAVGRVTMTDVVAVHPVPPFSASILDGYAVVAEDGPGEYPVAYRCVAGVDFGSQALQRGEVAYITTGAKLPLGANAVVGYEKTELVSESADGTEKSVRILRAAKAGADIRTVGMDICAKEVVLTAPHTIRPTDVGLCATVGATTVTVATRPRVGVLSTGDELVDMKESLSGAKIRDCNRVMLLSWLKEQGAVPIDLGIVQDSVQSTGAALDGAIADCDVVITTGGVSMGEADLLKQLLAERGTIHFGRLNMKPGKPTTFATVPREGGRSPCLIFSMPGNPVSCMVCTLLLVAPALKRLAGHPSDSCGWAEVSVRVAQPMTMDPERPNYHRCFVSWDSNTQQLCARSTGVQRSSRLLSMKGANALVLVPQASGSVPAGANLPAYLIEPIALPPPGARAGGKSFAKSSPQAGAMRACVLTVSDRASEGKYTDQSGPAVAYALDSSSGTIASVVATAIVPDEPDAIRAAVQGWCNGPSPPDIIITTGGTGFGPRDSTPEAIKPLLHREAPGVVFALLQAAQTANPLGVLSRPVAGTCGRTFVVRA
eukprot:SAG31_NODE_1667_length_7578_cov_4.345233_2_plen_739_part_00